MKNFKDLFHNTNDIIIAAAIVIVAAGLIIWRFHVILEYPQVIANKTNRKQSEESLSSTSSVKAGSAFKNGALKKNISVSLSEGGSETAVAELVDKNIFDDYSQFKTAVESKGKATSDVDAGTYNFKKGQSIDEVISTLVG